ncbi:hypothetical protein G6321_00053430 [Bradyrhizobium barranii subsp. barranii]|uniref:Uncharacterized protein n=1 Tax=Bradyrhizobium barranii subsp. barranii TaxID=2823807 RepID=A0A7Z0Q9G5_9BRAD|nr:hypothetical protein [Bradyrhizobium barranii]UGX94254.1 hypothetical protein G6321_00053430 [Bradyrhizobium barranii subsp. barranii]
MKVEKSIQEQVNRRSFRAEWRSTLPTWFSDALVNLDLTVDDDRKLHKMTITLDNLATLAASHRVDFSKELGQEKEGISRLLSSGLISKQAAEQLTSFAPARLLIKWGNDKGLLVEGEASEYLEWFGPKRIL